MKWYFTTPTVTLLNYSKFWSNLSHISSLFCTIFCKRVHCGGARVALATSATPTVNEFAKKMCKNDYKCDKHYPPKFTTIL